MAKAARVANPAIAPALSAEESSFFETRGGNDIPPEPTPDAPETPDPSTPETPDVSRETPAPEPEEVEHVDEAGNLVKPPKGFVPNTALRQEREARRAAEKQAQAKERDFATLQTRLETLAQLAQAQNQPKPAVPEEIPDITVDPVGHFQVKTAQLEQRLAQEQQWREQQTQQQTAQNNVQRLTQIAASQEQEFAKTHADYNDAATMVREQEAAYLRLLKIPEDQIQMRLAQGAANIAAQALQMGMNPAEFIYETAKSRGYKPKAPNGNGSAQTQAQPAAVAQATQQIQAVARGQVAGQSIGQIAGAASPPTTLESLLKLSDKEFAEATKGDNWRKLIETGHR